MLQKALLLLAVLLLAGCVSQTAPSAYATPRPISMRTPTPAPVGMTRDNPVPFGDDLDRDSFVIADDGILLAVGSVWRGEEAWVPIKRSNMLNPKPKATMEYVLVAVAVGFAGDSNQTKRVSSLYFRCVGEGGAIYDQALVVLDPSLDIELFGGGTHVGLVAFELPKSERNLVLIYSGLGTKARYLALDH